MNREPIYLNADVIAMLTALVKAQNEGKCEIFFELYGHVEQLGIKVYAPNWFSGADSSYNDNIYLTRTEDLSYTMKLIGEAKDRLIAYLDSLPAQQAFLTPKIDPMQKKVTNLDEAKAHFADSIDTVNGEKDGESKELTSLAEAVAFYAETTGDGSGEQLPPANDELKTGEADGLQKTGDELLVESTGEAVKDLLEEKVDSADTANAEADAQLQAAQSHEQIADNGEGRV